MHASPLHATKDHASTDQACHWALAGICIWELTVIVHLQVYAFGKLKEIFDAIAAICTVRDKSANAVKTDLRNLRADCASKYPTLRSQHIDAIFDPHQTLK